MFQDAFIKLEREDCESVLEEINPVLEGRSFEPGTATILSYDLSFYPGYRFFDIANHETVPPLQQFVIYKTGDVTVLDWTNEPVYALNQSVPVKIDEQTVCDYAHFFFTYIRGRHGRFIVTETVDDIMWREDPPPSARLAIGKMLEPLHITGKSDDGVYHLRVCMMFKDSLFKSDVSITPDGTVTLSDEELLIEDMPVLDDTLGQ